MVSIRNMALLQLQYLPTIWLCSTLFFQFENTYKLKDLFRCWLFWKNINDCISMLIWNKHFKNISLYNSCHYFPIILSALKLFVFVFPSFLINSINIMFLEKLNYLTKLVYYFIIHLHWIYAEFYWHVFFLHCSKDSSRYSMAVSLVQWQAVKGLFNCPT